MASKIKVDQIQTADGSGTIALQNQLSGMTSASMPTGSVIQVAESGSWDTSQTTSTSFVDSNAFINFTPTATSSKVFISFSIPVMNPTTTDKARGAIRLKRIIGGSSTIIWNSADFTELLQVRGSPSEVNPVISGVWLDSPNTTAQIEYRIQMVRTDGTFKVYSDTNGSKIVCQEIKG